MSSLVQRIHKTNNVSRNVFDLSNNIDFVTCAGQLLPVRCDDVLPGSEYRFNQSYFMRTLPLVVPTFGRMKVHFDNFFVPYRLLGTDVQNIIVGNNRGMMSNYNDGTYSSSNNSLPWVLNSDLSPIQTDLASSLTDIFDASGASYYDTSPVLFNALGYGIDPVGSYSPFATSDSVPVSNGASVLFKGNDVASSARQRLSVLSRSSDLPTSWSLGCSILPLLSYQKIYQDYYRNKLWEEENRSSYFLETSDYGSRMTIDTLAQRGMIEMRYHDFDKDRITGMIPDASNVFSGGINFTQVSLAGQPVDGIFSSGNNTLGPNLVPDGSGSSGTSTAVASTSVALNALSLRRLEAFQKFAEITAMNKGDYKHQIKAHFGMDIPDLNSDYCQYLGGFEDIVNISDVENNTSEQAGALTGKGVSSSSSRQFTFQAKEHGMIMTICYILPLVDYGNLFLERHCTRLNRYDFAIPEFDSIGFEPVRHMDVYNTFANSPLSNDELYPTDIIGYLPRYWSYKTKLDVAHVPFYNGQDKSDNLNYGSYVIRFPYAKFLEDCYRGTTYKGLKVTPDITDNLFSVSYQNSIQNSPFIVTFYDRCSAMLPLSVSGLPY